MASCRPSFLVSKLVASTYSCGRRWNNHPSVVAVGSLSSSSSSSSSHQHNNKQIRCVWSCPLTLSTTTTTATAATTRAPYTTALPLSSQRHRLFSTTTTPTSDSDKNSDSNSGVGVFDKLACIGTGVMATAILEPLIQQGIQPADKITVYDVNDLLMDETVAKFKGIKASRSLSELVQDANLVLCAVKPQNLTPGFFKEIQKGVQAQDSILLSIVAGTPISTFEQGGSFTRIVRSMPNTPAKIGQGMTVWSCTSNLNTQDRQKIRKVLGTFGKQLYVDDESFIDMATSISGSGPAYIFMLMEAMIDAGVHMGFPRDKATTLVYHTMLGSTLYAMETKEHPAILRNSVTSPSGTTASALYELESGKFRTVVQDAVWACYRRSLEMGHHDSNVGPGRTPQRHLFPPQMQQQQQQQASSASTATTAESGDGSSSTTGDDTTPVSIQGGFEHHERVK